MAGTLYLIPVPLGPTAPQDSLPANVLATVRPLTHFVVEQAKTARAF
jgi:16S rRNA (cytidine1402-2'-O)-methyltransferase